MTRAGIAEQRTQTATNRWVVRIRGELDLATGRVLVADAHDLARQRRSVDFDLGGVTFADSSGWASVRAAARILEEAGLVARIVNPSPAVRKVTGLLARHPEGRRAPGARGPLWTWPALPPAAAAAPLPPAA